ncbi:MAG: PAS domain-containing sensor histidine kinase [Bacteroidales bacterium]|nr:PAS domain-containing sensor histidine kinase [Bacteroidales bacterium]
MVGKYQDKTKEDLIQELESIQKIFDGLIHTFGLSSRDLNLTALKDYQSWIKYLMSAAHIAWWESNLSDGSILFDTRQAEMLGFPPDQFKHYQDFRDLFHPDDLPGVVQAMKDHLEGKVDRYDTEYRILSASGDYYWFRDVGSVLKRLEDGTPIIVAGIVIDITERRNAEEEAKLKTKQLQKINGEKDKFFSIIAHDLKSPLNSFLGFTNLMMENIDDMSPEDIREMSRLMNASANNLSRLLDNLLEWSRMSRGMIVYEPETIKLSEEVNDTIHHLYTTATKKQIHLSADVDEKISIVADRNMLRCILRNLIYNALKFTPRGGSVKIRSYFQNDGFVVTEVRDSGIGMDQMMLGDLFKLDVDTKRPGTEDEPTTGLGLVLCKDFVEKNGGVIWVASKVGEGSSFCFSLPFVK